LMAFRTDKEAWEPVIESLLALTIGDSSLEKHVSLIREAWSLEWQHHGESAALNHSVLANHPPGVSVYKWAAAIRHFVLQKRRDGRRVVGIGHSAEACAM
ncbi:hypothetical protein CERSUDRAFT_56798, partial [Gelatoporia subvermispora B]